MDAIPKEVVALNEPHVAIKDILLNLSEDNIQQSIDQIKESNYLSSNESKKRFFSHLIAVVKIRTKNIDLYVRLALELSNSNLLDLNLSCLDCLIKSDYGKYLHPAVYFLYLLYKQSLLDFDDLMREFFADYLPKLWVDHIELTSVLFFWFIIEIKEKCTFKNYIISESMQERAGNHEDRLEVYDVFDHMVWSAETNQQLNYLGDSDGLYEFNDVDMDFIKKEWNKRKKCIIYTTIENDDVEKLQEIASSPEFDINMKIKKFYYDPNAMIRKQYQEYRNNVQQISLLALSAYFGSIKCFKYIITNNVNEEDVMKFAIAGGNIEIIRLCEKWCNNWQSAASIAVRYHMNDVFEWIFDNYGDRTNDHDFFIDCAISNNIKITYFLVSHGLLPKSCIKKNEWSNVYNDALDYANKNRSNEVASILKVLPRPIAPKEVNKKNSTPNWFNLFRT